MLDLRRLDILVRFAAHGSITAVAAELGYSPSAISQQLATLEREAGLALLERTAHSAFLTAAGQELAAHAGLVLDAAQTAQNRMRARAGTIGGQVTVSCIPGLAVALAPRLAALQQRHPELVVIAREIGSVDAAAAVRQRGCDLAVIDDWTQHPPSAPAGLTATRLRHEQVVLAVPAEHPAAEAATPVSVAALRGIIEAATLICAPVGHLSRGATDQRLAAITARPARRWEFEGLHVIAALVGAGAGTAFLPESIAGNQAGVTGLPVAPAMHRRILAMTRGATGNDPAVAACLAAVRDALDAGS
ncbi:MAG TPA: LysR family transcriptional regulator [Pseudonocardiaceae bacterium]|jgi:DNA-binding transcriptional LysR family regulator|nr:LysR family transcriptional regulator [Pseudonocardiaceae bacterium]